MADIKLFSFEGKPIEKLIEVVSNGIGVLYKPKAIRKEADAQAYAIGIIENAKAIAIANGKEIDFDTNERLSERLLNRELKRQQNIDAVVEIAANELSSERCISDEDVDLDWTTRFFNITQDISDVEMQKLWGQILAGEVKKPRSYSLRTMELLKNLSKDEAQTFVKIANLSLFGAQKYFIFNPDNGKFLEENFAIKFPDLLLLKEVGLLLSEENLQIQFEAPHSEDTTTIIQYQNKGLVIDRKVGAPIIKLKVLVFTSIASELLKLTQPTFELKYIQLIKSRIASEFVDIKYGDILDESDGQISVTNIQQIFD